MAVAMRVTELLFDELADVPVAWLRGSGGESLPICVGVAEATELALLIEEEVQGASVRDLPGRLITALGAQLGDIEIHDIDGARFRARISVMLGAREARLECRPVEALALALRHDRPIWVHDHVMSRVSAHHTDGSRSTSDWKNYLESLHDDAFGKYKM